MREKNQIEQEANDIIDEINKVQEKIKTLMQVDKYVQLMSACPFGGVSRILFFFAEFVQQNAI